MRDPHTMTRAEITAELMALDRRWTEFQAELDEGYGGSPGEWMVERMNQLTTALDRGAHR